MIVPKKSLFLAGAALACISAASAQDSPEGKSSELGELTALADKYGTDKGTKHHCYTQVYEVFMRPMKYEAKKIFEIGVRRGASLKTFRDYFPNAVIYGIDIKDTARLDSEKIKTFVADQADRGLLQSFIDAHGVDFDLILDDGGHTMEQQQVSFGFLFKFVKPGGYYIIEDVSTSRFDLFGAEYGAEEDEGNSTLTMINDFMRGRGIHSKYLSAEELKYLEENIRYANLFSISKMNGQSMACIFKKVDPADPAGLDRRPGDAKPWQRIGEKRDQAEPEEEDPAGSDD